jgi:catechol-2,3-dioxygenase
MPNVETPAVPAAETAPIPPAPPAIGLFEVVLEVADLAAAERFYHEALGLAIVERWEGDRPAVWLALGREATLGLWPRETGGAKAIHGGRGGAHVHFAVRVPRGALARMQARLAALGYPVEGGWTFAPGDHAIYLDDPDGNVVELTERVTVWGGGPATE